MLRHGQSAELTHRLDRLHCRFCFRFNQRVLRFRPASTTDGRKLDNRVEGDFDRHTSFDRRVSEVGH